VTTAAVREWLQERLPLAPIAAAVRHKRVPQHRHAYAYYLGGVTLFLFAIQVGTGALLLLYYRPSASEAYESVQFIMTRVPFGWLIRSIHAWAANLMVAAAVAHMFSVLFLHSYRRPRELTWVSGMLLLGLTLGFGFTGYLLPWNQLAFFATRVGTDIMSAVPLVGEFLVTFTRGGPEVTGATLTRLFGMHVAILPMIVTVLIAVHLLLVQAHGMSVPPKVAQQAAQSGTAVRTLPFVPHFVLRELFGWTVALALLAALAAFYPWELGQKADPFAPAPAGIQPEWYFLWMFQALKYFPATIAGINGELFVIAGLGMFGLLALAVPFLARSDRAWRIVRWAGVMALIVMTLLTLLATTAHAQDRTADAERAFKGDVHAAAGLQCTSCHGTGPVARTAIATMCAKCHSDAAFMRPFDPQVRVDQFSQYLTSAHGQAMAKGETRVATCSDCHGAHGVTRVRDTRSPVAPLNVAKTCATCHADTQRMAAFGHDAMVLDDWSSSVHATALLKRGDTSAPTCNTCHGSHGATPPGVGEVANVCAQCHVREADLFNASPKKAIFEAMGQPQCLACHSNHAIKTPTDAWIGLAEPAVCAVCHDASSNGAQTITSVRQHLDSLAAGIDTTHAIIERAEHAGMLVDEARVALQKAREQQIQSRVLVHAFAEAPFTPVATAGLDAARAGQQGGENALAELQTRRQGLAVATLFIVGFLITLAVKIRRLPAD
jgi:predicted CXXCH cytochrome family protein